MLAAPAAIAAFALNLVLGLPGPDRAPARTAPRFTPRPLTAAAEIAGINFGVWAINHYLTDEFYSYVNWETMWQNFRDGWEWDRSQFHINFYNHPYGGSLFFNAARANGLGYWGSSLATLGGSLMWEMIMEKYRPSINDLVATTAGGCVLGEIGHRFSALVRKSEARGLGRIWREALGTVLDPVGALNRLLDGRKDGIAGYPGSPDPDRLLDGQLVVAGPVLIRGAGLTGTRAAPLLGFTLSYGDPAGMGWAGKPFDVFAIRGRFRCSPDKPQLSLFIDGALFGKKLPGRETASHFLGLYQHFEYYGIDTMRIAGTSFTGGWTSRIGSDPGLQLTASARLGWLALGGSDDFTGTTGQRRSYNMATGVTAAAGLTLTARGFELGEIVWRHYALFNLDVLDSLAGRESWDILQGQICVPVRSRIGIGLAAEYCSRRYDFRDFGPGSRNAVEARAFVVWQF